MKPFNLLLLILFSLALWACIITGVMAVAAVLL